MRFFTRFLVLFALFCTGCQPHKNLQTPELESSKLENSDQINDLFARAMRYSALDKSQRQAECGKLKSLYQTKPDWLIAWLLSYSFDDGCISLDERLDLLQTLITSKETIEALQWLNKNQITLLNQLVKYQKKSKSLRRQLKEAQKRLKKVNAKIQALKAIETSINKKLDGQPTKRQ